MRLADFIESRMGTILAEWDDFAASQLPAAQHMSPLALRNHGENILYAIAKDLREPQSAVQQDLKARGVTSAVVLATETAAQTHAFLRAGHGFNVNQLAAEYRALRSSVLRIWANADSLGTNEVEDMIRFNEAVDQALAESIAVFSRRVGEARDLTLGMFGHDLRSPLSAIRMSASLLKKTSGSPEVVRVIGVVESACRQMNGLLEDLVDFNRVRLGLGLHIERVEFDLRRLCEEEVSLIQAAHPERKLEIHSTGSCVGQFDGKRLQQLLGNLLVNAISHGSPEGPVKVRLRGTPGEVVVEVSNRGPIIAQEDLSRIFEPLKRAGKPQSGRDPAGSLGLGLYIAQEIAVAHGGKISVVSRDGETTFAAALPRQSEVASTSQLKTDDALQAPPNSVLQSECRV